VEFFRRYAELARQHGDDGEVIPLGEATRKILERSADASKR
jgi:hypothetical protein